MLEISNVDVGKPEWNLNETHIIIPVIDGDVTNKESDKILTSALTLSSLDKGDQTILTNGLEHSFVIGLDKNLFETPNYNSDLVIIQDSDLKIPSGQSELKNPVAYTISYVNQDKSEILWRTPESKDRFCASDKGVLEVRDVLNYNDSMRELEKTEEAINLNTDIALQVVKTDSDIILEKPVNDKNSGKKSQHFNYFAASQNTETVPIFEHLVISKSSQNLELEEKKFLDFKSHTSLNAEQVYKLGENIQDNIFNITKSKRSQPFQLTDYKTNVIQKVNLNKNNDIKDENVDSEKIVERGSSSLLEKSLPLKKKLKMKRTLASFSFENQKALLRQDMVTINQHVNLKFSSGNKIKSPLTTKNFSKDRNPCQSDSDETFKNLISNLTKARKFKTHLRKRKKNVSNFQAQDGENESCELDNNVLEEDETTKTDIPGFGRNKCNNINELIDCLRKCRMINASVWQTLNSGLQEMKVDILKEMNAKKWKTNSPESTNYSPQLKAFALVLYFKQPAAFKYLSQVYKNGWPSLNVIKKWKRRINSYQRPNFVRIGRNTESSKS